MPTAVVLIDTTVQCAGRGALAGRMHVCGIAAGSCFAGLSCLDGVPGTQGEVEKEKPKK